VLSLLYDGEIKMCIKNFQRKRLKELCSRRRHFGLLQQVWVAEVTFVQLVPGESCGESLGTRIPADRRTENTACKSVIISG